MLDGLDPGQRSAAEAGGGLVVARAGAGTGKTRMLTTRIAYLVSRGEPSGSVLATTFTRKAAAEMLERAVSIGGDAVSGVQIRTIDSVAVRLLRRHWQAAGLPARDFVLADDQEAEAVLVEALEEVGLVQPGEEAATRREMARDVARRISRWKENGLMPSDLAEGVRPRLGQADRDAAIAYGPFDAGMRRRALLEFSDLCRLAGNLLGARPDILAEEAEAIRWLLVDEAQDINHAQLRLLRLLSSHHGNVTLVGDDDQSLYSWRGSIPRFMESAADLFPAAAGIGVLHADLVTNRRCTDEVLRAANAIVDHNPRPDPKVLVSGRSGSPVEVVVFRDGNLEADGVAGRIADLVAGGVDPSEIAVLARTGAALEATARSLLLRAIPHEIQSGTALWDRGEVRDIVAYLKLALIPDLDVAFRRIVSRPARGLGPAAAETILDRAADRHISIHEAIEELLSEGLVKSSGREGAAILARHLRNLSDAASQGADAESLVDHVVREMGYGDWSTSQAGAPKTLMSSFDNLREIARLRPVLVDFLGELAVGGDGDERVVGGVHVGTLHGSKGLEWDHVFLVAFEEGVLPSRRALDEADKASGPSHLDPASPYRTDAAGGLEEERRLAHVGLTRARHGAVVSLARQRDRNNVPRPARPSRFLEEGGLRLPADAPRTGTGSGFSAPPAPPAPEPRKRRKVVW